MKFLSLIVTIFALSACASTGSNVRYVWDIQDQAKFNADWAKCTSLALAYQYGDDFRTQCMASHGNVIKVVNE